MALFKLLLEVPTELAESIGQVLVELGAGAVEEQVEEAGSRLIVYGDDEALLVGLGERARDALDEYELGGTQTGLSWRVEADPGSDWDTAWTRHLAPQVLTQRWVVQPIWDETQPPAGMQRIWYQPTLAFGDGAHPTTRLAAQAVESFCMAAPGARVLDVGSGTGILAFVAALSGAGEVLGIEVDAVALTAARANAQLNGLSPTVGFLEASAPLVAGFELVVANLEPRILLEEAPSIAERAGQARQLVLTGFLSEQAAAVSERFARMGFREIDRVEVEGWCLLVLGPMR
ncbi:MAG TPA: 50S ribosomal protein L11 methyltransferase [Polyangiaceae bacterium]|nr:50S ribosomal protein L11 methyltransferase [Polyangiaceae bacterium]